MSKVLSEESWKTAQRIVLGAGSSYHRSSRRCRRRIYRYRVRSDRGYLLADRFCIYLQGTRLEGCMECTGGLCQYTVYRIDPDFYFRSIWKLSDQITCAGSGCNGYHGYQLEPVCCCITAEPDTVSARMYHGYGTDHSDRYTDPASDRYCDWYLADSVWYHDGIELRHWSADTSGWSRALYRICGWQG